MPFPRDFTWGAATAAYQIEGAAHEDGRGLSVWDMLCRNPGRIAGGDTGAVACDHYHRYVEDVALMKDMGLQAYRFSISWSRVLPEGTGAINQVGIDFYSRLVDELLAAGIKPYATLFHWDFPYELFCQGGWLHRDSAAWFGEYAALLAERLGDRISDWMTFNEPQCFVGLGHGNGVHAPGIQLGEAEMLRITHNVLRAHGSAVQALRGGCALPGQIGIAPVGQLSLPASDSAADIEAARRRSFDLSQPTGLWSSGWWLDPIVKGAYGADMVDSRAELMPAIADGDMELIAQPIDFIGLNVYQGMNAAKAADNAAGYENAEYPGDVPRTAFNWPVVPDSLYWSARFHHERYQLPIVITENGLSNRDWIGVDGQVHDPQRIDFATRYLRALERSITDGADVQAYFHWSLMDNFEWAEGYKQRFGLIHVDYATGTRTPKDSAAWYRGVIASNGGAL